MAAFVAAGPVWAQASYDDHELTDRFYITVGGFRQNDIRTTFQLNAKVPGAGIAAGAIVALESFLGVDDEVTTWRLDGWYRLNKKSRIGWTFWSADREGLSAYSGDPIDIGDITISDGDFVATDDSTDLYAVNYAYSFLNTQKYEFWLGLGLNFQSLHTQIVVDVGGGGVQTIEEEAKATVPIPTLQFGGRWNFTRKLRLLLVQEVFGIKVGEYNGKLSNTRVLAEYDIIRNFGIGAGFERFDFQVDIDTDSFLGRFDTSYTGLSLYLKGQI
jgi:hypothetical protein